MKRTLAQSVLSPWQTRPAFRLLLISACWLSLTVVAKASWLDDVGYTKLANTLGTQMLTGQGVFISQVEAGFQGNTNEYFPDPNSIQFDASLDPFGVEPTFVNGSSGTHPSPTFSLHATNVVAKLYYGDKFGQARGANTIVVYGATDFLGNFLNCGGSGCANTAPDQPTFIDPSDGQLKSYVVQNHSWAGTLGSDLADQRALRKIDFLVDQYELTTVVGVNNGNANDPHPTLDNLLAHSYNAIAVGVSHGEHAIGPTSSLYGPGRSRPSIVAPLGSVSSATATVSGVAALMHEVVSGTPASRSEPMRAIILAGATKSEFTDFIDPDTGLVDPWNRTQSQPLDSILGAGEVNVFNSYLITQGGQFAGSTTSTPTPVDSYGWDYQTVNSSNDRTYQFEIPAGSTATELSIALTWNVEIDPPFSTQSLANLSLTLKNSVGTVDQSISNVDNTEHIYIGPGQAVTALGPGTYTLEVDTTLSRDYGLAWRMSTLFDEPSADFDEDLDVDGFDFLTWQRNVGTLLGAEHGDGDADGDRDVDAADLAIFETGYGVPPPLIANLHAVPEPGALVLVAISGALLLLAARRKS